MKREIRDKWCAALRSGEYRQIKERLSDGNGGFCANGLFAHVVTGAKNIHYYEMALALIEGGIADPSITAYKALSSWSDVTTKQFNYPMDVARMNNSGSSFHDIAAYIEEHFPVEGDPEDPQPISTEQLVAFIKQPVLVR